MTPSKHLQQVRELMGQRQFDEALNLLSKSSAEERLLPETNYLYSVCYLQKDNFEKALEYIQKAVELDPSQAAYLSERGVIYFHLDKKSLALLDMDVALKMEPKNPYRYSSRAFIKDSMGDVQGAISDYEKAIELDPSDAVAHNNLGLLQEKLGYQEKAKTNFSKADELSKEWETLLDNDKEQPSTTEKVKEEPPPPPEEEKKPSTSDHLRVMKDVFFKKDTFREFTRYWKNKFSGKKPDQ